MACVDRQADRALHGVAILVRFEALRSLLLLLEIKGSNDPGLTLAGAENGSCGL